MTNQLATTAEQRCNDASETSALQEGTSQPTADSDDAEDHAHFSEGDQAPHVPDNVNDDFEDLPNDTLAALLLLRSHFPMVWNRDTAPLVLRSQIYSIVKDRTVVDRQLDELRCIILSCGL